jgi:phosphoglycerate dehydrogenase-like enzyme
MKVLILDEDYRQYQQLLLAQGVAADAGCDPTVFPADYDALLAQPDLAAQYLEQGGQTPWVQSTWAGVDALVTAAGAAGVVVTGVKDIFGPQMAEYVFGYLLSDVRSLPFFRAQQDSRCWSPVPPKTLTGKTMSVLGTGTIGAHVAGVAQSFGMETRGVSRSGQRHKNFDVVGSADEILNVLAGTDVLINTLPGTEQTRGILNASLLDVLSTDATLFNLGRGNALCEDGLRNWLKAHERASAVLDVFAAEPLASDHWLWQHPQISITPHISAFSFPGDVVKLFMENLRLRSRGDDLEHVIDLDLGY